MAEQYIDSLMMREMVNSAAAFLEQNKDAINDLNVFPVPDGDTGTNMLATIVSAAREVNSCPQDAPVSQIIKALSNGALRGARGNSGVILSQIFRGFYNGIDRNAEKVGAIELASALNAGVEAAYKAVMRPKEGTILTVAKAMAESGNRNANEGLGVDLFLERVIEDGIDMLNKTPDMLPVLKEAGVVDAGGAGLIAIYTGFKMAVTGVEVETSLDLAPKKKVEVPKASAKDDISTANIQYGYCSEFFIKKFHEGAKQEDIDKLREKLLRFGDSLVMVGDLDLLKVHVHSNMPGKVLQYALSLGELSDIKIENMREQHTELAWADETKEPEEDLKLFAVVAVAAGEGLSEILNELAVDGIISGGQSMNPSADDIAEAVKKAKAKEVIVLPNNKNIILAAQQAGELAGKNVHVIPSKSFPQGLAAMLAFNPEAELEENLEAMNEAIGAISSGEVTTAVRDSHINGEAIEKDEFLGICEGEIVSHEKSLKDAVMGMLGSMVTDESSVISFYTGEETDEAEDEEMKAGIEALYPSCEVDFYSGKQPVYRYIVSVE